MTQKNVHINHNFCRRSPNPDLDNYMSIISPVSGFHLNFASPNYDFPCPFSFGLLVSFPPSSACPAFAESNRHQPLILAPESDSGDLMSFFFLEGAGTEALLFIQVISNIAFLVNPFLLTSVRPACPRADTLKCFDSNSPVRPSWVMMKLARHLKNLVCVHIRCAHRNSYMPEERSCSRRIDYMRCIQISEHKKATVDAVEGICDYTVSARNHCICAQNWSWDSKLQCDFIDL